MLIRNANLLNPGTERGIYDILIREGKIARIAPHIEAEEEVELDVQEMYVTPGLVDAHTHLGLKADSQGEFYADHNEKKSILSPEMRAIDAINPQNVNFEEARKAGIPAGFEGERDPALDHGTMIPLYFYRKYGSLDKVKVVRIGLSGSTPASKPWATSSTTWSWTPISP